MPELLNEALRLSRADSICRDEAVRLAKKAEECYAKSDQSVSFGQWVLQSAYANHVIELRRARDFAGTARTSDGRIYLVGYLLSGSLPIEPLRDFLKKHEKMVVSA